MTQTDSSHRRLLERLVNPQPIGDRLGHESLLSMGYAALRSYYFGWDRRIRKTFVTAKVSWRILEQPMLQRGHAYKD